jgi:glycine/D-amino acid oxidase-like deaminating enzyme
LLADGCELGADIVVLAAGAWTTGLWPALEARVRTFAVPVFHLAVPPGAALDGPSFPVFTVDSATGGHFGFPRGSEGTVKVGFNGLGRPSSADDPDRTVRDDARQRMRDFLARSLPSLARAPVVAELERAYSTTVDERFVIARDPACPSIVVASAGAGHAFKFAPVLGDILAGVVEGGEHPKFGWPPHD